MCHKYIRICLYTFPLIFIQKIFKNLERIIHLKTHKYSVSTNQGIFKPKKMNQKSINHVIDFMEQFAINTGLHPESSHPKRYLWTDAFAVCNYLELYNGMNDKKYLNLAIKLVDQVHNILGKYRKENPKTGWISGLDLYEGGNHPTRGGLRIGKDMDERMPNEPFNERLEWDRDGQYYHYLTKWMHSLNNTSMATGNVKYIKWALELAKTAHAHFTYAPDQGTVKRMYWKMSIDLKRPLIPSMGQHDPLDGYITYNEIQMGMKNLGLIESTKSPLEHEIVDMKEICLGMSLITNDPLGIGGLLFDAIRITQLIMRGSINHFELLEKVLEASIVGLRSYIGDNPSDIPAEYRLAFRELGLSIGIKGLVSIIELIGDKNEFSTRKSLINRFNDLKRYTDIGAVIEKFWIDDENRKTKNWIDHKDINTVMLATTLAPQGFLRVI